MYDLIVRAAETVLVICKNESEQQRVIDDCVENGFGWDVPAHSSDVVGLDEYDVEVWLSV